MRHKRAAACYLVNKNEYCKSGVSNSTSSDFCLIMSIDM